MVRGGSEQALVVRVAADDPVQDDDVRGLDGVCVGGDVVQPPLHPLRDPRLLREGACLALVLGRELEVDRAGGAGLQQLDLDLTDAAADLEHRGALDAAGRDEVGDPLRGPVEAALPVLARDPAGEAPVEELSVPTPVAVAAHAGVSCFGS
jgi:hypothetical protein